MNNRAVLLWTITVIVTFGSVVYQRMTGPTYPVVGRVEIASDIIQYTLPRSHETISAAQVEVRVADTNIVGEMQWRRYKSHDTLMTQPLVRAGDILLATIPVQPPAGKVIYKITLIDNSGERHDLSEEPIILRYKGHVPLFVLYPHIILMFSAMLLATRTGLEAAFKGIRCYRYTILTSIGLLVGGLILGPIVQKYAFGEYWTGWPVGHDLTDTKTAFAMIPWLVALWRGRSEGKGRVWMIVAAVITLLVYLIPHSVLGSELDYTKTE